MSRILLGVNALSLKSSMISSLVPAPLPLYTPLPSSRCASSDLNLVQACGCPGGMTAIVLVLSSGVSHCQSPRATWPLKWDDPYSGFMSPNRLNQSYTLSYFLTTTLLDDSTHVP